MQKLLTALLAEGLNEWRVKLLQEELQTLRTTQNEYLQLRCLVPLQQMIRIIEKIMPKILPHLLTITMLLHREQLNKVQAELTYTSNKCSALSQENELLRGQPRMPPCPVEEADPLSEQVAPSPMRYCIASFKQLTRLPQHKRQAFQPRCCAGCCSAAGTPRREGKAGLRQCPACLRK